MTLRRLVIVVLLAGGAFSLVALAPRGTILRAPAVAVAAAPLESSQCKPVGGVLMTNIGTIPFGPNGATNLGPVFGDLAGSVAATPIAGAVGYHHYWVTTSGDTINFKDAILNADPTDLLEGGSVVAVRWGHYRSVINGGTGKFDGARGYLDYFGLADFNATDPGTNQPGLTLVLRYRGEVCYAR